MVNRITRILALAALCTAPGRLAFAQAYAVDGPVPAYPPEVYRAQDADGGFAARAIGPDQAYYSQPDRDRDRSDHARYDRDGYDQGSRRGQPQGRVLEDERAHRQAPAYAGAYRQASSQRVERVETSYRFLSWAGKVEDTGPDRGSGGYGYSSNQGYAGPACPGVQPGERVLDCQYVPFAPPPEPESDARLSNLYIDGGVGPTVIGGGGGGGGGPSNGQVTLGTGFSGVTAPSFNGGGGGGNSGGSGNGSGNGSGSGSGAGVGTGSGVGSAMSSSSSSSSASANASANISANITVAGGFFIHGGGGHGGGGKSGGCGCGSSGGGGMTGWGGGGKKK